MNANAYDEQVRSLINGRLRGMGKRLSTYCAAVVDGGDIEELSRDFADGVDGAIEDGVREVWEVSDTMRREMQDEARKRKRKTFRDAVITAALSLALQSFLTRKERVMVDDMAQHLARQTRSALPLLTGEGTKERGRQLAEYIKTPVRINIDKTNHSEGNTPILQSQPSFISRMRRILVTEIATAYRTAEYHAWQLLPFVVGQEIRLGKKHPVPDICDDLQGIYPKEFKFTGWHPWCRCFARPVFSWESDKVKDMPENFNEWMEKNAEKIEKAREKGTLPQWIKDNEKYVGMKPTSSIRTNDIADPYNDIPDKKGKFVEESHNSMMANLQELSENYTHEEAYVKLANGKVYYKRGDEKGVNFDEEERAMFANGDLFHNHKNETLSPDDISFAINNKLKSIVAVTGDVNYEALITSETIVMSKGEILKLYKQCGDEIEKRMQDMNSVEYTNALLNFQHLNMEALCRILKVDYKQYSK